MNDEMYEDAQYQETDQAQEGGQQHRERERWQGLSGEKKSPAAAAALSLLPGLGQVYCGFYQRGFTHVAVVATVILLLNASGLGALQPFFGIFLPFFWLYNVIDASRCAQAVNRAMHGGVMENLPEPPVSFSAGGRTAGVVLIVLGMLLLGVTVFDFDLAWLADWWPVFLIAIGAKMVWKGR